MSPEPTSRSRRRWAGFTLVLLVLAALALVAVPIFLIQPFSPQTSRGLAVSFVLRRWAPLATILALIGGLALAIMLWRGGRWWSRTLVVLALVPLVGAVWLARFNVFEHLFAPLGDVRFARVAEADWMDDGDMVLAVEHNGDAAAYPVRQMAYHHIVEDTVGGVPVAVTY